MTSHGHRSCGRCCEGIRPPLEGGVLRSTARASPENHVHHKALPRARPQSTNQGEQSMHRTIFMGVLTGAMARPIACVSGAPLR